MEHRKVYVEVMATFREDGLLLPKEIVWEDGQHYEIDKVKRIQQAAAMKVGGQGERYTLLIKGHADTRLPRSHVSRPCASPLWLIALLLTLRKKVAVNALGDFTGGVADDV